MMSIFEKCSLFAILKLLLLCNFISCELTDGHLKQLFLGNHTFSAYHHYQDTVNLFQSLTMKYPGIAKYGSIGKSVENRDIFYLELASNIDDRRDDRPKVKLVGNMHGDETIGREIIIYLALYLLDNQDDERCSTILKNMRLYLMPSLNPDGFENSPEGSCDHNKGRNNANGVDLNRDFPDQFVAKSAYASHAVETSVMMKWILDNKFVMSANFHGGSEVASYPWDSSARHAYQGYYSKAPDDDFFKLMAHTYANAHSTMHLNNKKCDEDQFVDGVTNGAEWYDVPGGMQDYNYVHGDCLEITLELTCCKYPMADQLEAEWHKNKEALLQFVELAMRGVRGLVKDSWSGKGLEGVEVKTVGIDKSMTTDINGHYWRLLTPGTYTIVFSKEGYVPSELTVTVGDGMYSQLNVELVEAPCCKLDNVAATQIELYHNVAEFRHPFDLLIVFNDLLCLMIYHYCFN